MKIKNKNFRIYLLIIIGVVIVTLIGISFAYFSANVTNDASADVTVTLPDKASLTFSKSGDLLIDATMSNFAEDKGNLSESSTSTVKLVASGDYSANYYVYFEILSNDFVYTTDTSDAELLLVIEDNAGNPVTSVSGLSYVTTDDDISGFDITTKTGLFTISGAETISLSNGNAEETETYTFTLYFINLDTNQNDNTGKTFEGQILMQEEKIPTRDDVVNESGTLKEAILLHNYLDETKEVGNLANATTYLDDKADPIFTTTATTDEGMYSATDDYGTSYYFRGDVDDNWVSFAGFIWQIVRIDGNGNIKLIYAGTDAEDLADDNIGESKFNSTYNDPAYVGYTYTLGQFEVDENSLDSDAKVAIDKWYENNLIDYSSYLADVIWCNDRSVYTKSGTIGYFTYSESSYNTTDYRYFGAYSRIYYGNLSINPTFMCSNTNDAYTVYESTTSSGLTTNGYLEYPIALITADEMVYAGAGPANSSSSTNTSFYLYTGSIFRILSPIASTNAGEALVFGFNSAGYLGIYSTNINIGLRVTISLLSGVSVISGDGSLDMPYVVG